MSENGEFAPAGRDIAAMLGVDPEAASSAHLEEVPVVPPVAPPPVADSHIAEPVIEGGAHAGPIESGSNLPGEGSTGTLVMDDVPAAPAVQPAQGGVDQLQGDQAILQPPSQHIAPTPEPPLQGQNIDKDDADREITKDTDLKADETVSLPDGTLVDTGKHNTKISSDGGPTITVKRDGTVEVEEISGDAVSVRTLDENGRTTLSNGTTIVSKDGVTTITLASGDKIIVDKDGKTAVDIATDMEVPETEAPGGGDDAGGGSPGGGSPGGGSPGGGSPGGGSPGGDTPGGGGPPGPGESEGPPNGSTPQPPGATTTDIEVSASALRSDAKAWDNISEDFTDIGGGVDDLTLDAVEFGLAFPLHSGYKAITAKFGELVNAGSTEFDTIAQMLRQNAKDYDDTESENVDSTTHIVEV